MLAPEPAGAGTAAQKRVVCASRPAAVRSRVQRPEFERVKGQVEQARGVFGCQPVSGSIASRCCVMPGRPRQPMPLREVVSEFGQRRIRHVLSETLNGVGDLPMQSHSTRGT